MRTDVALVGPTASGKSGLALEISQALGGVEIVSVDSMQVYRGMDIGTAKPSVAEQGNVPHHLIDLADASDEVSLAEFAAAAKATVKRIHSRGNRVMFVGGTGLYFQCVVDGFELPGQYPEIRQELDVNPDTVKLHEKLTVLDPLGASRMEPTNRRRVLRALEVSMGSNRAFSSFGPGIDHFPHRDDLQIFGLWLPRSVNNRLIDQRVEDMLTRGWVDEVKALKVRGLSKTAAQALGYKDLLAYLDGRMPFDEVKEVICNRTRAFARRQRMWFRRDPRIQWHATERDARRLLSALLRECSR